MIHMVCNPYCDIFFNHLFYLFKGARGIEPPPDFADRANGFEARGAPSTIAPKLYLFSS